MIAKEEIDEVAKEMCFLLNTKYRCTADCSNCELDEYNKWSHYRVPARRVIIKVRKLEGR